MPCGEYIRAQNEVCATKCCPAGGCGKSCCLCCLSLYSTPLLVGLGPFDGMWVIVARGEFCPVEETEDGKPVIAKYYDCYLDKPDVYNQKTKSILKDYILGELGLDMCGCEPNPVPILDFGAKNVKLKSPEEQKMSRGVVASAKEEDVEEDSPNAKDAEAVENDKEEAGEGEETV